MKTAVRFGLIVAIFVALGPPLGAVATGLLGSIGALLLYHDTGTAGLFFYGGMMAVAVSWVFGGVQAAFAGAVAASARLFTTIPPVLAGTAAGLAAGAFYAFRENADPMMAVLMLVAHVVPAAICGWVVRAV